MANNVSTTTLPDCPEDDLVSLPEMRFCGDDCPGHTDEWTFCCSNCGSLIDDDESMCECRGEDDDDIW